MVWKTLNVGINKIEYVCDEVFYNSIFYCRFEPDYQKCKDRKYGDSKWAYKKT